MFLLRFPQYLGFDDFSETPSLIEYSEQELSVRGCDDDLPVVTDMVKAYILIKTTVGEEDSVLSKVLSLPVTEEAHKVFGPWDVVAEVRGRDMETLVEIITEKVRKIKGIEDTQSILVIDYESE